MVKFWEVQQDVGIKITRRRIKYAEKNGIGKMAMEEKATLVKQEKHKKDRLQNQ